MRYTAQCGISAYSFLHVCVIVFEETFHLRSYWAPQGKAIVNHTCPSKIYMSAFRDIGIITIFSIFL